MNILAKNTRFCSFKGAASVIFASAMTFYSAPATSQDFNGNSDIENCRLIQSPSSRLSCYDALFNVSPKPISKAPEIKATNPTPAPVIIAPTPKTTNFPIKEAGITPAPEPILTDNNKLTQSTEGFRETQKAKDENKSVSSITSEILRTKEFGYKKTRFFLENGQVWDQVDGYNLRVPRVRNGIPNSAQIRTAALGSFLLRINGKGRAIRVRRIK